ncbi:MAG: hypothetical protein ACE37K_13495 [Planctomycetota bacterium]
MPLPLSVPLCYGSSYPDLSDIKFGGSCFEFVGHSDGRGWFATCRHVVDDCPEGHSPFICDALETTNRDPKFYPILEVRPHPKVDFAALHIDFSDSDHRWNPEWRWFGPAPDDGLLDDVSAAGWVIETCGSGTHLLSRRLKGYVTRTIATPDYIPGAGDACLEVSFPSVVGFSGAALVAPDHNSSTPPPERVVGMMFQNHRSRVDESLEHEFTDGRGMTERERIASIVNFGLAHPVSVILSCLNDLGLGR